MKTAQVPCASTAFAYSLAVSIEDGIDLLIQLILQPLFELFLRQMKSGQIDFCLDDQPMKMCKAPEQVHILLEILIVCKGIVAAIAIAQNSEPVVQSLVEGRQVVLTSSRSQAEDHDRRFRIKLGRAVYPHVALASLLVPVPDNDGGGFIDLAVFALYLQFFKPVHDRSHIPFG